MGKKIPGNNDKRLMLAEVAYVILSSLKIFLSDTFYET